MMYRFVTGVSTAVLTILPTAAVADTLQEILPNASDFDFDVTSYDDGGGSGVRGNATASGTSNGIGWQIGPTNLWSGRTTTDGTFEFEALPGITTDNLHPSDDFTITFDQPIDKLVVVLSNDNLNDAVNFGIVPTETRGANTDEFGQITLQTAAGGIVLFENIQSLTVTHVNNNGIFDGFDMAFHAIPVEPE
jgi:hypothetical protein